MSKSTPRKPRHRNQHSNSGPRQIPASDYDSDAAHYMEARELPRTLHVPTRSNTDLNLSVLGRYLPGIRGILSIAANAVVYVFSEATQGWDKHGVEGTMFVCEQDPFVASNGQGLPQVSVFVLNRRGMDNVVVDLMRVSDCEVVGELLIFRLEDNDSSGSSGSSEEGGGSAEKRVIGIWIHADEDDTREANNTIIRGAWQQARLALDSFLEAAAAAEHLANERLGDRNHGAAVSESGADTPGSISKPGPLNGKGTMDEIKPPPTPRLLSSAVLSSAVQTQLSLIASFDRWLDHHLEAGRDYGNMPTWVKRRLSAYKKDLVEAERAPSSMTASLLKNANQWGFKVDTKEDGRIEIMRAPTCLFPGVSIMPHDEAEADFIAGFLGYMEKVCNAFERAEKEIAALVEAVVAFEAERASLSQPAEVTIQSHVKLLKEYNDMKDYGQQMIGLIAENLGFPARNFYETGQYGVGPKD
ncbi:hypothetical protein B0T26DRAFT_738222 [Lasiosphaeria miniovina]|uniref:Uncharacterized protein n=1 Tax=Lasiosphaeria miniovina TaxID=1954250 RepID=A0AA40E4A1_9PEZI|nr:uncharacterized protein B0T26DRAFT_738222 [Lasiosphaeria miniovina]KAK0727549.1 hypothetical protein B0T26DRAFT_738222 [Lasiosphaeria miniovina]